MPFITLTRIMSDGDDHEYELETQHVVDFTTVDYGGNDVTEITVEGQSDNVLVRETIVEIMEKLSCVKPTA